jgi:hypothetical protein
MLLASAATWGQGAVTQVLEEVVGFTDGEAIRVNRDDEATVISQLDVVGSDFRACELTAAGLVCLQGADIQLRREIGCLVARTRTCLLTRKRTV